MGGGLLVTSLLTLLTPLVAEWNVYLLVVLRVLEGFSEVSQKGPKTLKYMECEKS